MPNANIIAEHLTNELDQQRAIATDLRISREGRNRAIARVRQLEQQLDEPHVELVKSDTVALAAAFGGDVVRQRQGEPLKTLTLTLHQLQVARNELKTLSYTDVGAIIHGLRCAIQKGGEGDAHNRELLERILRLAGPCTND